MGVAHYYPCQADNEKEVRQSLPGMIKAVAASAHPDLPIIFHLPNGETMAFSSHGEPLDIESHVSVLAASLETELQGALHDERD